jgi:hypothetical protein
MVGRDMKAESLPELECRTRDHSVNRMLLVSQLVPTLGIEPGHWQ